MVQLYMINSTVYKYNNVDITNITQRFVIVNTYIKMCKC